MQITQYCLFCLILCLRYKQTFTPNFCSQPIHSVVPSILNAQAESTTPPTLVNPNFSSWSEHLNKHDSNMFMGSDTSPIFHEYEYFPFKDFLDHKLTNYLCFLFINFCNIDYLRSQSSATVISVKSEPTLHNDKQSPEGFKAKSLSEECLQLWHDTLKLYPTLMGMRLILQSCRVLYYPRLFNSFLPRNF